MTLTRRETIDIDDVLSRLNDVAAEETNGSQSVSASDELSAGDQTRAPHTIQETTDDAGPSSDTSFSDPSLTLMDVDPAWNGPDIIDPALQCVSDLSWDCLDIMDPALHYTSDLPWLSPEHETFTSGSDPPDSMTIDRAPTDDFHGKDNPNSRPTARLETSYLVLSISCPDAEQVHAIVGMLMRSKTKFQSEMHLTENTF